MALLLATLIPVANAALNPRDAAPNPLRLALATGDLRKEKVTFSGFPPRRECVVPESSVFLRRPHVERTDAQGQTGVGKKRVQ